MPRPMKDSGIEWLGEIPAHWKLAPLKAVCSCFGRIGFRGYTQEDLVDEGEGAITLSPTNIIDSKLTLKKCSYISWNKYYESPEIMLFKGDIVFVKTASVGKCAIYDSDEKATVNPQFVVLKDIKCDRKFLFYTLISSVIQSPLALSNFGSVIGTITQKQLLSYKVCIPPLDEQQRIATFLDGECARIDSVIEKTRVSVEEYKKLKQALITRAVIKGIRPNRPMKQSGVEWLGDIPDGWDCRKLKTFSDVISKGATPKDLVNEINDDHCIRYIKSENIVDNRLIDKPEFGIRLDTHEKELKRSQLSERDILFVIAGASIGKTAIMRQELVPSNTNQATSFIRIKAKYIQSQKFIWYALQSDIVKKYISLYAVQSAQPNLSMADLGDMKIPIPPLEEQKEIAQYLDEKTAAIDSLVAKKNQLAEELTSLKKSLIFEYVTGKKEAPEKA